MTVPLNKNKTNLRNIDYLRYYCQRAYRRRILRNMGLHPEDPRKGLRFCTHHPIQTMKIKTEWYNKHNRKKTTICKMNLPKPLIMPNNENQRSNKGIGRDRYLIRHISEANKEKEKGNVDVVSMLLMSQVIEQTEMLTPAIVNINDTTAHLSGLHLPVAD